MKKKYLILLIVLALIVMSAFFLFRKYAKVPTNNDNVENAQGSQPGDSQELSFLLDGYPIDEVPLYKVREVSSNKLIINWDPKNISIFDDKDFIYYNVVFYTDASQEELLDYYKGFFDEEIIDEYPMPDMVKGYIGKYRVTAAHYDSDDTAYIQVYLPSDEFTTENMYFTDYPDIFADDPMFVENENSYGLLNQVGGQVEYTRYFTVIDSGDQDDDGEDDVDEFAVLKEKYEEINKDKADYQYDENNHMMIWEEDGYTVRVSFTRDHGRIYSNIRGSMEDE